MSNEWGRFYFPENVPLSGFRKSSPTNNWVTYTIFIYFNFSASYSAWLSVYWWGEPSTNQQRPDFIYTTQ